MDTIEWLVSKKELILLFKEIVLTISGALAAYVAVQGLGAWRRQLRGKSNHDLARNILIKLYKYQEAISGVRNPFLINSDIPENERQDKTPSQIQYLQYKKAYMERWGRVSEVRAELHPDLLEAVVLWGSKAKNICKPLFRLETELLITLRNDIRMRNPDSSQEERDAAAKLNKNRRDILHETDENDPFKEDFNRELEKIELFLRERLSL